MAIIIEENEKKGNIFGIVGWIVFLAIAVGAIYYIFFAQPQLVVIPAAGGLSEVAPIAQLSLQPANAATPASTYKS